MTITNNIKKQIDLPVWEWLRFAPVASSAGSALCTSDDGTDRYIYYLSGTFYRYDTWNDNWQQLATPNIAPATSTALKYSKFAGYRGNILGATSSTLTIAGLKNGVLAGNKIRITNGTGIGQERTIVSVADAVIQEHGVLTAVSNSSLSDSTKKWKINQFIGQQVRVVFGTGQSQVRKVLYNDTTTLYFYDINYQQLEPWNNTVLSATAPYALPVATAGSQGHYVIETSVATIDSPWTINPDSSSSYGVLTGGIWALSSVASAPWSSFQYYDIASDTWTTKTAIGGHLLAGLGTDWSIERTGEVGGAFIAESAVTSASAKALVDTTKSMVVGQYSNYQIRITLGTGAGQRRRIIQSGVNNFQVEKTWDVIPDTTSKYTVYGDVDKIFLIGNANASMYQYSVELDCWSTGSTFDYGTARNGGIGFAGQEHFGNAGITRNTGGITSVGAIVAGGTGYTVGDILTASTAGTNGKVRVVSTNAGVVTAIELFSCGSGYATGTSATTGGTGTSCTFTISTVGVVGRVTTVSNHNFAIGDTAIFSGATEALWNTSSTILGCDSLTAFDIATTATASYVSANLQSATTLVDATKSWAVNEHAGRLVSISTAGNAPTTQIRRIVSNTATVLTLQSAITPAITGTSRYVIQCPMLFGRDEQYRVQTRGNNGVATSGSTTTIVDTTKSWLPNQWLNYKVRIVSGTGLASEMVITSNTPTTLTFATQAFTVDTTTEYLVMDTFGLATAGTTTSLTDSAKNWGVNQWAGKRVRISSGAGQSQEATIASNTATVLTFTTAVSTAPATDSTYSILGIPVRGTNCCLNWIFGNSDNTTKGKYILSARGGGSQLFDRYDITRETWDYSLFTSPQTETLSTGSMYVYDGDRLYFHVNSTGRILCLNVNTLEVDTIGLHPYTHSTALAGNRMEIFTTEDGLKYLVIMRHSGQELWRLLISN